VTAHQPAAPATLMLLLLFVLLGPAEVVQPEEVHRHSAYTTCISPEGHTPSRGTSSKAQEACRWCADQACTRSGVERSVHFREGAICMRFVILGFSSLRTLIDAWHVRLLHESLEIMLHKIWQFSGTHNPSVRTRTGASGAYGPWGCRRVGSRNSDGAFDCQLTSFFFIWREILPNL
jgi:hypothetical protein